MLVSRMRPGMCRWQVGCLSETALREPLLGIGSSHGVRGAARANMQQCACQQFNMGVCRWQVGCLSEMPPEGKVGVSAVCILGVNINRGQEISLRLRTDDLRGFRRYDSIRQTLCHELVHMVCPESFQAA